ncbi:unnamed protein product [Closterium sp. NIES-64]|nr:unnamed protein product [Closterium sp. NIES-64]
MPAGVAEPAAVEEVGGNAHVLRGLRGGTGAGMVRANVSGRREWRREPGIDERRAENGVAAEFGLAAEGRQQAQRAGRQLSEVSGGGWCAESMHVNALAPRWRTQAAARHTLMMLIPLPPAVCPHPPRCAVAPTPAVLCSPNPAVLCAPNPTVLCVPIPSCWAVRAAAVGAARSGGEGRGGVGVALQPHAADGPPSLPRSWASTCSHAASRVGWGGVGWGGVRMPFLHITPLFLLHFPQPPPPPPPFLHPPLPPLLYAFPCYVPLVALLLRSCWPLVAAHVPVIWLRPGSLVPLEFSVKVTTSRCLPCRATHTRSLLSALTPCSLSLGLQWPIRVDHVCTVLSVVEVPHWQTPTAEELRERYFGRHLELNSHDLVCALLPRPLSPSLPCSLTRARASHAHQQPDIFALTQQFGVDDRKDAAFRPGGDGESVVAVAQRTARLIRHIEEDLDGWVDLHAQKSMHAWGALANEGFLCAGLGTTAMVRAAALLLVLPALAILSVVDPEVAKPAWDDGVVDGVDADLFRRAMVQIDDARLAEPRGKIAFLFLVRGPLPLQEIWHRFFQGHEAQFSVYIHASQPDFDCDRAVNYAAFRGRQIPSVPISWGGPNLIRAERRLLAAALADPANQRFVLLSESYAMTPCAPASPPPALCVPLFNFSHVYDYLFASPTSFITRWAHCHVGRCHVAHCHVGHCQVGGLPGGRIRIAGWVGGLTSHPSEWRYQPGMAPTVNRSQFRKGSQWFALTRRHADMVVADTHVFLTRATSRRSFWYLPCALLSIAFLLSFASAAAPLPLASFHSVHSSTGPSFHHVYQPPSALAPTPPAHPALPLPCNVLLLPLRPSPLTPHLSLHLLSSQRPFPTHQMQDPGGVEPRGVTFLHWQPTAGRHPLTITAEQLTPDFLRSIQRTRLPPKEAIGFLRVPAPRLCQLAGRPTHCFLFARKFNASAIPALLALSPPSASRPPRSLPPLLSPGL